MTREKSYWPLYAASVLAWFVMFAAPALWRVHTKGVALLDEYYAGVPSVAPDVLEREQNAIETAIKTPTDDPITYYPLLLRINSMERSIAKGDREAAWGGSVDPLVYRRAQMRGNALRNALYEAYNRKHTSAVMAATAERYFKENPGHQDTESPPITPFWEALPALYLSWLPFALFMLLLRLDAAGLSVLREILGVPWRLALATFAAPVSFGFYPKTDVVRQRIQSLRFAAITLGSLLCGGGIAKAQTAPGSASGKDDPKRRWALQVDLRPSGVIAGPSEDPVPAGFARATVIAPSGGFLETVTVGQRGFILNSTVVGRPVFTMGPFVTNAVAGAVWDSAGGRSLQAGLQVFGSTHRFGLAMPVLAVERSLGPMSRTTFVNTAQLVAKTGRLRLGGEYSLRKPDDGPLGWSAGPLIQTTTPGGFVEAAALRNASGDWRLRGRLVHNFGPASAPESPEFTATLTTSIRSQYVGVLALTPHDRPVVQSSATVSHGPSGLYAGIWHSASPNGSANNDWGDEVDYYAGIGRRVGPLALDAGYLYFDILPIGTLRSDLYDAYLSVSAPSTTLRPYLRADWIVGRDPDILEGGLAWRAGVRPSMGPVTADVSVAGHDGIVGIRPEPTSSGRAVLSATRTLFNKKAAVTPFLAFQKRFGAAGGIARDRVWFGVDLAWNASF